MPAAAAPPPAAAPPAAVPASAVSGAAVHGVAGPGVAGSGGAAPGPGARPAPPNAGWVGTWEGPGTLDATDDLTGVTARNVLRISVGGTAVRVRLSNRFGTGPLLLGRVTVARAVSGDGPAARPGSMRTVTFHGRVPVRVPAGHDVLSDPVPLTVPDRADLLVSVFVQRQAGPATQHQLAMRTSYLAPGGDHAADPADPADPDGQPFTGETSTWFFATGVDVLATGIRGAVVAFGDSITDGYMSSYGADHRYPDFLAQRLLRQPPGRRMAVQNAGISGNRLLLPGMYDAFGPSATERLDTDALSRTGARSLLVLEGINDIQQEPHQTDPDRIVAALREIAHRAHRHGLRVIIGTMTPFEGWPDYTPELEVVRVAVNDALRGDPAFDAVVDFDRVVRDPAAPQRLLPAYDSGDHLHPDDAGYAAMAAAVDLDQL
ncbi:hypothetical protein CIK06_15680 [Plantactinospora sp. KBS50]|nr:hypothetical protein CIK06_15680 [Plantactinospora sp. KBS50]